MLTLCYSSDAYRLQHATDTVGRCSCIDGTEEHAPEELEHFLKYPSFFAEQRSLIIRNAAIPEIVELIARYDAAAMHDVAVFALQDTSAKNYDKKSLTKLEKLANTTTAFEPLTGIARTDWIKAFCAERDVAIEPAALTTLLQRVPGQTAVLAHELEKLCAYTQGRGPIDRTAVIALVSTQTERDEWELANALTSLDKRRAVVALWRRFQEGAPELLLLGSVVFGIRKLLSSQNRYAKVSDASLRKTHHMLAELDRAAKDGRADTRDGLFQILLAL